MLTFSNKSNRVIHIPYSCYSWDILPVMMLTVIQGYCRPFRIEPLQILLFYCCPSYGFTLLFPSCLLFPPLETPIPLATGSSSPSVDFFLQFPCSCGNLAFMLLFSFLCFIIMCHDIFSPPNKLIHRAYEFN